MKAIVQTIVSNAQTLLERVSERSWSDTALSESELSEVHKRLTRWVYNVAEGNPETFLRRVKHLTVTEAELIFVLRTEQGARVGGIPIWAEILEEAFDITDSGESADQSLSSDIPVTNSRSNQDPFAIFVSVARNRIRQQLGNSSWILSEQAHKDMELALASRIDFVSSQTIQTEYTIHQAAQECDSQIGTESYYQFIRSLGQDNLQTFLTKYCVLARIVATLTCQWIENYVELVRRISEDSHRIKSQFSIDITHVKISKVHHSLSDPHHGGRSVLILEFEDHKKLVYKPRELDCEEAFYLLVGLLNEIGLSLKLYAPKIVNRGEYGWIEYVPHLPVHSPQKAVDYYFRSGMLLYLFYVLGVKDIHYDNLIAFGEYPTPVDLEVLMCPIWNKQTYGASAFSFAEHEIETSVLKVGMLPQWDKDIHGTAINTGSLGYRGQKNSNVPYLKNSTITSEDYVDEVIAGFVAMHDFLGRAEVKAAWSKSVAALSTLKTRFVIRPTKAYYQLLRHSFHPSFLQHGLDWSIEFELLCQAAIENSNVSEQMIWDIVNEEALSIQDLDIPVFSLTASENELKIGSVGFRNCFESSGYQAVQQKIRQVGTSEVSQQSSYIRSSVRLSSDVEHPSDGSSSKFARSTQILLSRDDLVNAAYLIGEHVASRAIRYRDTVTWISAVYLAEIQKYRLGPISYDLYSGASGIGLFLAALAKYTGITKYTDLAVKTLTTVYDTLMIHGNIPRLGLGGLVGIGSVVYALLKAGDLVSSDRLIADAYSLSEHITIDFISNNTKLDLFSGIAGAALSLIALYRNCSNSDLLMKIDLCGQRLVKGLESTPNGQRSWPDANGRFLVGMSHGASGCLHALLQIYKITGDTCYYQAAEYGIAYEKSMYSAEHKNWPDLRTAQSSKPEFMTSWCHGAPGLGFARLVSLDVMDNMSIRQDLENAIGVTSQCEFDDRHSLCCGNIGRADFLLSSATTLDRMELQGNATNIASKVARHLVDRKGAGLGSARDGLMDKIGFYNGLSGIGYSLLRFADPSRFPSVLTLT